MKNLYITAEALVKELAKFNPGINNNDQASLETLAADAGTLAYQFVGLSVDISNKYKRIDKNEID